MNIREPTGAPIIWINGYPGVGKLTVARGMAANDNRVILIDNHTLIDPVDDIFPRAHPAYQAERRIFRQQALATWVLDPAYFQRPIIFTDCQTTSGTGPSVAHEYHLAARLADRPFVPLYLYCIETEHYRRLRSEERLRGSRRKLVDKDVLKTMMLETDLYQFDDVVGLIWLAEENEDPFDLGSVLLEEAYKIAASGV